MKKKYIFIAIIVLLVCILIPLYIFKVQTNNNSDSLESRLSKLVKKCLNRSNSLYVSCFRDSFDTLVPSYGVNEIITSLDLVYETPEFAHTTPSCHDISHIVGQVAIEKGRDLGETVINCTKTCQYGCAHGALIGGILKDPELLNNLSSVCEPFYSESYNPQDVDSCLHGLGHGVSEFASLDLFKSLELCGRVETDYGKNKCAEGVFMQTIDYVEVPTYKIRGSISEFCNSLSKDFKDVCFETASLHEYGRSKDVLFSAETCKIIPGKHYGKCLINLVNLLYSNYDADPQKLLSFCKEYGDLDYDSCVMGVIQPDILSDLSATVSIFICNNSEEEYKNRCFQSLGQRYKYAYGNMERVKFCSVFEDIHQKERCLKDN